MKPFVKWAGGKRQILNRIDEFIKASSPDGKEFRYIEPFLGGGAVFFNLAPQKAIINDLNSDLINAYNVIKSNEYIELIRKLKEYQDNYQNNPDGKNEYYYDIRQMDRRDGWPDNYTNVERAARMIFLNRTCYNGLYRVNSKGEFNTPIGRYQNPLICDEQNITEIHNYISNKENDIKIYNKSYEDILKLAKDGDIIYLDPPYDYEDDDGFTKYQMRGFSFEDFKKMKTCCDEAIRKGAIVIISNNATTKVLELFERDPLYQIIFYDLNEFTTLRTINCVGSERKTGKEVIYWGMPSNITFPQANNLENVIKLILSDETILNDKPQAKEIIGVNAERQVSYYLSALLFLGYITYRKCFTDKANRVRKTREATEKDLFETLYKDDIFGFAYKTQQLGQIDEQKVTKLIKEKQKDLSEATIERRRSTVKSWVKWMNEYSNRNKHK